MANWKTIAIIFIILFAVETAYVIMSIIEYEEEMDRKNECIIGVCEFNVDGSSLIADSFAYNYDTKACYCYNGSEVVRNKFMG